MLVTEVNVKLFLFLNMHPAMKTYWGCGGSYLPTQFQLNASSPNIKVIKLKRTRWAGHVARTGDAKKCTHFSRKT
jgi:hypothetical protein